MVLFGALWSSLIKGLTATPIIFLGRASGLTLSFRDGEPIAYRGLREDTGGERPALVEFLANMPDVNPESLRVVSVGRPPDAIHEHVP